MKSSVITFTAIWVCLLSMICPAFPQSPEELKTMREDILSLKEGQKVLQKELEIIKKQLVRPQVQEFKGAAIDITGARLKGNNDSKLIAVEVSDYQCPFCARHARGVAKEIDKQYVDTGQIRYAFLDFPLPFHQEAFKAAEAANCAGEQGEFWEMHDKLFENQKALKPADLKRYADEIRLDLNTFGQCLDSGKYADKIRKDMAESQKAGITGTPAILLGWLQTDGKTVKAVNLIKGAQPFTVFKAAVDSLLASKE